MFLSFYSFALCCIRSNTIFSIFLPLVAANFFSSSAASLFTCLFVAALSHIATIVISNSKESSSSFVLHRCSYAAVKRASFESRKSKPQVAITDNTVESEITLLETDPVTNELLKQVAAFLLETLAHPDEIHSWEFLDDKVFFALANAELGGYLKPQQVEELNRHCSESPLWSRNRTQKE